MALLGESRLTEGGYVAAQVGEELDVWVSRIREPALLELSMVESKVRHQQRNISGFIGVSEDDWLTGEVVSIQDYGLFVEVCPPGGGPPAVGMVHVTKMDAYMADLRETFHIGQEVKVCVLAVDEDLHRVELGLKST